jgi:hypothetical protein
MASSIFADILKWSEQRPLWQRDALRRIVTVGALTSSDFDELTEICKAAHGLASPQAAKPLASEHLPISGPAIGEVVSLTSLTHHSGVNALATEQTVAFGPNLTIVYGENAAGKSGYTRILKRACRSRFPENILSNVLSGSAPLKAKATVRVKQGPNDVELPWTPDAAPAPALAQVSVFDGHCVGVYLQDKTDVAFRPFGLDLFDKLASACAEVKKRLEASSQPLSTSLLPPLPGIAAGTKARQLIDTLSGLTKADDVRKLATLSPAEEKRLKHLAELKRDLQASDPKKRAAELSAKAHRFDLVAAHLKKLDGLLGLSGLAQLGNARDKLKAARLALATLQTKALTADLLPGSGGKEWRRMWEATEQFAAVASPGKTFPIEEGAKCPFCQQEILFDAAERLKHFGEFVTSTAQEDVRQAESAYASLWKVATSVVVQRPEDEAAIAEVVAEDSSLQPWIAQYLATAAEAQERVAALTEDGPEAIIVKTFEPAVESAIQTLSHQLRERAKKLQVSASSLSAAEQSELTELESRVALHDSLEIVLAEIDRRIRLALYGQCIDDTSTLHVTKKSTELTKLLVTDQLRQTFQSELKKVEFSHLSVEVQTAGASKGALFHKLVFSNAPGVKVTDVLSEGESRALSLAAFLTELSTAPTKSGIIFDDPVSSLDHNWRERVGRRLVAEAKDRQVIVFTHDLLFLRILISEGEKHDVACHHQYIRRDTQAGVCSADLPWVAMNVKDRLGVMKNRLQAATKAFNKEGADAYEPLGRDIFGQLRESWERAVAEVLLNDVIERYRPSIETKKVAPLHDITEDDCNAVDAAMTECSRWLRGHDEALADGTPFPQPNELKTRIDELEKWVKEIRDRRAKKK